MLRAIPIPRRLIFLSLPRQVLPVDGPVLPLPLPLPLPLHPLLQALHRRLSLLLRHLHLLLALLFLLYLRLHLLLILLLRLRLRFLPLLPPHRLRHLPLLLTLLTLLLPPHRLIRLRYLLRHPPHLLQEEEEQAEEQKSEEEEVPLQDHPPHLIHILLYPLPTQAHLHLAYLLLVHHHSYPHLRHFLQEEEGEAQEMEEDK
mmetsp:Transcript_2266/g.3153  ORF Transcript_2266/g.3153 Transcript_2266/m.3153 type:complete len:201 (-) Transcript_2266:265-867(-)